MPIHHLLVIESIAYIQRQGTFALTGRAHCQRQVAFFIMLFTNVNFLLWMVIMEWSTPDCWIFSGKDEEKDRYA